MASLLPLKVKKYQGFTLVEMLITMAVMVIVFLAIGNVLNTMIKTSNTVSSRMLVREEGEYLAEVFRKYIRNSSTDNVKLYFRDSPTISFNNYQVEGIGGDVVEYNEADTESFATEMHFRPSAEATDRVVCIGFFMDGQDDTKGYIVRSVTRFSGSLSVAYEPGNCFPSGPLFGQDFSKNFVVLNSDLVYIDGLEISRNNTTTNSYYTINVDMQPSWGVGGLSNYRSPDGSPTYRKSFVLQTRQILHR